MNHYNLYGCHNEEININGLLNQNKKANKCFFYQMNFGERSYRVKKQHLKLNKMESAQISYLVEIKFQKLTNNKLNNRKIVNI